MSLRLEEVPFEIAGKQYLLRCNMEVLETVQDLHGGDFKAVMEVPIKIARLEFLAAMLNDYAEEQGWEERWTAKSVRRRVSSAMLDEADILGLITRAITPIRPPVPAAAADPEQAEPENSGN